MVASFFPKMGKALGSILTKEKREERNGLGLSPQHKDNSTNFLELKER